MLLTTKLSFQPWEKMLIIGQFQTCMMCLSPFSLSFFVFFHSQLLCNPSSQHCFLLFVCTYRFFVFKNNLLGLVRLLACALVPIIYWVLGNLAEPPGCFLSQQLCRNSSGRGGWGCVSPVPRAPWTCQSECRSPQLLEFRSTAAWCPEDRALPYTGDALLRAEHSASSQPQWEPLY